jgi:hypothetical protein
MSRLLALLVIASGCIAAQSTKDVANAPAMEAFSARTQRPMYHSKETMWINLTIATNRDVTARIYAHGIKARNSERLRIKRSETLRQGINHIALKYRTPDCTGCAGIKAGNYTIGVDVAIAGENATQDMTVEIRQ